MQWVGLHCIVLSLLVSYCIALCCILLDGIGLHCVVLICFVLLFKCNRWSCAIVGFVLCCMRLDCFGLSCLVLYWIGLDWLGLY